MTCEEGTTFLFNDSPSCVLGYIFFNTNVVDAILFNIDSKQSPAKLIEFPVE